MLPAPTEEQRPQQSRSGRSNYRNKERTGPPYLRVEDLTEEPKRAKITGVQVRKTQYNDLTIKLALGGQNYFWGLTLANPNFKILFNLFGPDENRWMGEEFLIGLEFDEFSERNLMRAYPLDKAETKGARKKK